MGFRGIVLRRWSRRDRLAVFVVAVTVAFLTGTTLLVLATGTQTAGIAAQFESPGSAIYYDDPATARAAASDSSESVVLPVASVEVVRQNGTRVTAHVVGVPPDAPEPRDRPLRIANSTTLGTLQRGESHRLIGASGVHTVTVNPRGRSATVFAPDWYVTNTATVASLGETGAFVLHPGGQSGEHGVPLLGALAFFLAGTEEALQTLTAIAAGTSILIGVTVFSVSRMSVRDRLPTIQVIRVTGGTTRTVLSLFALRAVLLTVVGVSLGYAMGVIVSHGAVNLAVAVGLPTALSVSVSRITIGVLVPLYVVVTVVGAVAGVLAAWPVARRDPGLVTRAEKWMRHDRKGSHLSRLRPSLLGMRALVPTTATLTAFVVFVVVFGGLAGAAGPLVSAQGTTITEPGSSHPVNSQVPAVYADALRDRGISASGEILLFQVVDGQPFPARGAEFEAFSNVTDARLVRGRPHRTNDEAVVGRGLADTLDVQVGDRVTLGGSTRTGLTRVHVVGVYEAPGGFDDQLLVSLPTARHLAGRAPRTVHLIRADRLPEGGVNGSGVEIVDISAPARVVANSTVRVSVRVRNLGLESASRSIRVRLGDRRVERTVTVGAGQERTVRVPIRAGAPGEFQLVAGEQETTVTAVPRDAIWIEGLPQAAPPGSAPQVRIASSTGEPVAGATVRVSNMTRSTDDQGRVRLPLDDSGTTRVNVSVGDRSVSGIVEVREGVPRNPTSNLRVEPSTPSIVTRPTAHLRLSNPWNRTLVRDVQIRGPTTEPRWRVRLAPGESTSRSVVLDRQPPGSYEVETTLNGTSVQSESYRVTGDDRIVAAMASSGRTGSTGIGQALEVAFGNVQVLVGSLVVLAGLMTVGGTTATFAQAVHARRRTIGIYRATGATRSGILRRVLGDAVLVGTAGAVGAAGIAQIVLLGLAEWGYLTVFGVQIDPVMNLVEFAGVVLGGVVVTAVGATLATTGLILLAPARLLETAEVGPPGDRNSGKTHRTSHSRGGASVSAQLARTDEEVRDE